MVAQERVYGGIDVQTARHYSDLIEKNVFKGDIGSENIVDFLSEKQVLIHSHDPSKTSNLKDYYDRAKKLEAIKTNSEGKDARFNIIRMDGLYTGNDQNTPFLLAERLFLKNARDLNGAQLKEMENQFREQLYLAMDNGFKPGDVRIDDNCGLDLKTNKIRFYDVADWGTNFN